MKKMSLVLVGFLMLCGCSSKEVKEVEYVHENRQSIADRILGDSLSKDETSEIFNSDESLEVFYERIDENDIQLSIFNAMDYYFTGTIDFDVCPYKVSVTALPPNSLIHQKVECPDFVDNSEFVFDGKLYNRNEENAYSTKYEVIAYEDRDEYYDYALDLAFEDIDLDELKQLTKVIYEDSILVNYEGEVFVSVYPLDAYNVAYEENTVDAWNVLDTESFVGNIFVDVDNAMGEIYDKEMNLLERINLK